MNNLNVLVNRIKLGLGIVLLATLTGCIGWVGGDGSDGGGGWWGGRDTYVFGGGYDRGHDVRAYSNRGAASRAAAHPSGGGGHDSHK
jgi:hypothetical protein